MKQQKPLISLSANETLNTQNPQKQILAYNLNQILPTEDLWKHWGNSNQKWDEPESNWDEPESNWDGSNWDELPIQMQKWINKGNITNNQRVVINRWILENAFPEAFESTSHLYADKVDTNNTKNNWIEALQPTAKPALEGKSQSYVSNYNTKHLRKWWVIVLLHFVLLLSVAAMWSLRSYIPDVRELL
ncbi:hypothetical protein [Candidatus Uabimicrobium sp. HlEnr_7]|uniref:hypothetical protein n=1 Tax=Candidatus Uabimicrobium helgolandensis TaxID=3095367 RepID=UPI0035591C84